MGDSGGWRSFMYLGQKLIKSHGKIRPRLEGNCDFSFIVSALRWSDGVRRSRCGEAELILSTEFMRQIADRLYRRTSIVRGRGRNGNIAAKNDYGWIGLRLYGIGGELDCPIWRSPPRLSAQKCQTPASIEAGVWHISTLRRTDKVLALREFR
jgi:hypothetical protein